MFGQEKIRSNINPDEAASIWSNNTFYQFLVDIPEVKILY